MGGHQQPPRIFPGPDVLRKQVFSKEPDFQTCLKQSWGSNNGTVASCVIVTSFLIAVFNGSRMGVVEKGAGSWRIKSRLKIANIFSFTWTVQWPWNLEQQKKVIQYETIRKQTHLITMLGIPSSLKVEMLPKDAKVFPTRWFSFWMQS